MHDDLNPNTAPWRLMLSKFVDINYRVTCFKIEELSFFIKISSQKKCSKTHNHFN